MGTPRPLVGKPVASIVKQQWFTLHRYLEDTELLFLEQEWTAEIASVSDKFIGKIPIGKEEHDKLLAYFKDESGMEESGLEGADDDDDEAPEDDSSEDEDDLLEVEVQGEVEGAVGIPHEVEDGH